MEGIELNSKLLRGKVIKIGSIKLIPLTLDEIFDNIGFDEYNKFLSILCINIEQIQQLLKTEEYIEPYDYLVFNCLNDKKLEELICNSLNLFLKEKITFNKDGYFIIGDELLGIYLHKSNYNYFIEILKKQNCVEAEKIKAENSKEKDFFNQLKKMREKYSKYKKTQDIVDIMSAVCSKHPSINVFNVGQLTIYQLINAYKALMAIDSYYLSIESILHGASKDDVNVVHWADKIH